MEIEQLAVERPEALARVAGRRDRRHRRRQGRARSSTPPASTPRPPRRSSRVLKKLWTVYREEDATLVEVNPLVKTADGDDRRPRRQGHPRRERRLPPPRPRGARGRRRDRPARGWRAKEKDLNYVKLDGSVGIIGNGAGLVMSTLDVVAYAGEEFGGLKPANFLDIGGGASAEVMADGLEIILGDPQVKAVFVNVFGGITACDAVANGIVGALDDPRRRGATKPLVVRLDGNNVERGPRASSPTRNHPLVDASSTPWTAPPARPPSWPPATDPRARRETRHPWRSSSPRLQGHRPGHDRLRGHEAHRSACSRSGTDDRRRRQPAQGGHTVEFEGGVTVPVFGTVAEAIEATGADVSRGLRAAALHQGRRRRGDRRRHPARRRHHRGRRRSTTPPSSSSYAEETGHDAAHRPELPRPDQPRASPTPASSRPTSPGPGRIGLVSKSGTLTYQMMYELRDFGFSTAVGIGGDPIIGTTHIDCLEAFEDDPDTDAIVMIGEIGGDAEERAAAYIKDHVTKPVVGYVAGLHRARGQDDGPRRRHRLRLVGHRAGEEGGPRGRRASRSARRRPRPPT